MKTALVAVTAIVIALLTGCNGDRATLAPSGTVVIHKADFSKDELARIVEGVAAWNDVARGVRLRIWIDGDAGESGFTIRRGCPMRLDSDLASTWYDGPDARSICLSDRIEPSLMARVTSHEVGHALGLDHEEVSDPHETVMGGHGPLHHAAQPTCHDVHKIGLRCWGESE